MNSLAIIPTFLRNKKELEVAIATVESLKRTADCDAVVIDDGSPDYSLVTQLFDKAEKCGFECIAKTNNEGFAATVNIGLSEARDTARDAVLINADIEFIEEGWLEHLNEGNEAVMGALLIYPNGLIQHAGIYYSVITRNFAHILQYAPMKIDIAQVSRICPVTAALQLIRNPCLQFIGLYDDKFRLGWEDVDYCIRVFEGGYKCAYKPKCVAVHHEGFFRRGNPSRQIKEWQLESWKYLHEKHMGTEFSKYIPTLVYDHEYNYG